MTLAPSPRRFPSTRSGDVRELSLSLQILNSGGVSPYDVTCPIPDSAEIRGGPAIPVKEHTRETIAGGRNSTFQMHRMWIFAWDHNTRQPMRVEGSDPRSRAVIAGAPTRRLARLEREFYTRRHSLREMPVPESITRVWLARLDSPPVRWSEPQKGFGPRVTKYAKLDLSYGISAG